MWNKKCISKNRRKKGKRVLISGSWKGNRRVSFYRSVDRSVRARWAAGAGDPEVGKKFNCRKCWGSSYRSIDWLIEWSDALRHMNYYNRKPKSAENVNRMSQTLVRSFQSCFGKNGRKEECGWSEGKKGLGRQRHLPGHLPLNQSID